MFATWWVSRCVDAMGRAARVMAPSALFNSNLKLLHRWRNEAGQAGRDRRSGCRRSDRDCRDVSRVRARSAPGLYQPHPGDGGTRPADRTEVALAESVCRTPDWVTPARLLGSCPDLWRTAFAAGLSIPDIYDEDAHGPGLRAVRGRLRGAARHIKTGVVKSERRRAAYYASVRLWR